MGLSKPCFHVLSRLCSLEFQPADVCGDFAGGEFMVLCSVAIHGTHAVLPLPQPSRPLPQAHLFLLPPSWAETEPGEEEVELLDISSLINGVPAPAASQVCAHLHSITTHLVGWRCGDQSWTRSVNSTCM